MSREERTSAVALALRRKSRESARLIESLVDAEGERLVACARAMSGAFECRARLFSFGNGGSAADASHVAVELMHPVIEKRPALPAFALSGDSTFITAVSNDSDFALVFAEQLRALARPGDIALALSTSGKSASVVRGLTAARELGMLSVALSGRDGGRLPELADHCFVVPSFSIHRIQEAHGVLLHLLWDAIHLCRGEEDVL